MGPGTKAPCNLFVILAPLLRLLPSELFLPGVRKTRGRVRGRGRCLPSFKRVLFFFLTLILNLKQYSFFFSFFFLKIDPTPRFTEGPLLVKDLWF